MFSPMKLLILVVLIAAVWFGFKAIGRVRAKAGPRSRSSTRSIRTSTTTSANVHASAAAAGHTRG